MWQSKRNFHSQTKSFINIFSMHFSLHLNYIDNEAHRTFMLQREFLFFFMKNTLKALFYGICHKKNESDKTLHIVIHFMRKGNYKFLKFSVTHAKQSYDKNFQFRAKFLKEFSWQCWTWSLFWFWVSIFVFLNYPKYNA